jgi:hypothetical protein
MVTKRRLAGVFGLGYVIGVSIENQEVLNAPTLGSSAGAIRDNYSDTAFGIVTEIAGGLALPAYAVFAVLLCAWLRESTPAGPWRTVALIGGIGGPLIAAVALAATVTLIADNGGLGDGTVEWLSDSALRLRFVAGIFVAMFQGAIGITALRSRALPWPLPQLALLIAAAMVFAPLAAIVDAHGLEVAVSIAFASQTLWIFLTGMWLVLAEGASPLEFLQRATFLLLVIAAGLVGIALLAVPEATGRFFAWVLMPEPLAAFAGGVYVGSAAAYGLALALPSRAVRPLVLGAVVLAVSVFIVTMAHTDQFDFSRLQAVMWVVLFASFSLVTAALYVLNREGGASASLPGSVRALFGAVAAGGAALALALWIHPTGLAGPSPFEIPPLGGGFAGSWVALLAVVCAVPAFSGRADEARAAAYLLICLPAGALLAGLRTVDQLEPAGAGAAYLTVLALLVVAGVAALLGSSGRPNISRAPATPAPARPSPG